ncbi:hypothetical protein ACVNS2_09915 [Paenibacillus caseinilyticus]|nr:hypothetical protein [Paenibacillus mucilaginosus]
MPIKFGIKAHDRDGTFWYNGNTKNAADQRIRPFGRHDLPAPAAAAAQQDRVKE